MIKNIALLPGDGVGPEVVLETVKILKKIAGKYHHSFKFNSGLIGAAAIDKTGNPLPEETLDICKKSDAILFGAIGDPVYDNDPNAKIRPEQGLLKLRKSLGLFANLRPVKVFNDLINSSPLKKDSVTGVDLIVVRELTGGIYFGTPRKRINNGETAIDTSLYSKDEIRRIAITAFELSRNRKKNLVSVDKANVLETSRLWRETVTETALKFPEVALNHMFVDNAAMQIIKQPARFDVILTENMFGDILTDEASVIAGSIGLLPSASLGTEHALYEPIHGAFNKAAGKNIANPIATILSSAMMLKMSFKMEKEAEDVEKAVETVINKGFRTRDIAPDRTPAEFILGTAEMGEKISEFIN